MAATQAEPYVGLVNVEGLLRKAKSFTDGEFSGMAAKLGIKGHLDKLIRSLAIINDMLFDADTHINRSEVRRWLEEINVLFAPLDDLLDEFAYEARRPKVGLRCKEKLDKVGRFFSASNRNRKMSHRLKDVGSKYEGLVRRASEINVANASEQYDHFRRRETDPYSATSEMLVGGDDLLNLKDRILGAGNDQELSFISLFGMAGIGKTTLARVVYNDVDVMSHFDVRIWIYVSKERDIFRILKHMLESVTHHRVDEVLIETVLLKLLERLKGKKYLLVLDDVWNEDYSMWDSFTQCLLKLGGSRGSKILVTTRLQRVADSFKPGLTYKVNILPEEHCWILFRQIAIAGSGLEMTPQLEQVGRRIVHSCGGLPLAVKVKASLARLRRIEEWEMIAINKAPGSEIVDDILKLSYDNLPSISLKQCFLYCSIFPKGSVMEKDELIQLWMAQGLLNPPQGRDLSMEDLGAKYLGILVGTSILQDAELDEVDGKKFYKMHDLLHDLALSLSNYQCSIMEGIKVAADDFGVHLSVINCEVSILEPLNNKYKRLRTLHWVNSGVLGDMLAYTTSLRVLIVVDWLLEELPASISRLKLLYYLDISKTKIQKLPDSISTLYNLQTLRLYDLIEQPRNFQNLVNLRHLFIGNFQDLDKLSVLPSQAETVLNPSSLKACFKVHLHDNYPTENLKKLLDRPDLHYCLRIYRLENVSGYEKEEEEKKKAIKKELSRISKISTIESLRLHWNARRENCYDEDVLEDLPPHSNIKDLAIENYKGPAFPSWMQNTSQPLILHHLEKMELEDCSYCEQFPPLGHLPSLKVVKIRGMVNVKSIGAEFYGLTDVDDQSSSSGSPLTARTVFPKLRELTLRELTSLEEWSEPVTLSNHSSTVCPLLEKFEVEQCPKLKRLPNVITSSCELLRRLEVAWCDSLDCLPEGVVGLKSLEDLEIHGLPSLSKLSIGHCRNLTSLTIGGILEVDDNTQPLHLTGGSGELASLPEQLQYLSALKFFTISGYGGLESLPEWFSKLQFLQILKLEFCWKLMYLPAAEKMQQLKNLDELDICYCPLLEARCTKGSRPELHKISHIPRIMINSEEIKFRPLNKNKNTTNTQTLRNRAKKSEKSGNRERNVGERKQQGRNATLSSSQPADQSAGVGNEEILVKDSASLPKPPQQQETTAIGSNSTDDVPASPKPSIESKDKGKDKLSTQTVVDGLSSRSGRIVINEGGFKEKAGAGSDRIFSKGSACSPSPPQQQEKIAVASNSNDYLPISANPSVESKDEDKSKSAGAGSERTLVQDSASLPSPPQQQEITAIGCDSNDDKPSIKPKDEVMAELPTPTAVGGVSSDTYSVFNYQNASKKVELSKVVVNEFSESSGAGNGRILVKDSASPTCPPPHQEITAFGSNSDHAGPVSTGPSVESKDEGKSKLPTLNVVGGVSSDTSCTAIEVKASKEVELSKELATEFSESAGTGRQKTLVKGNTRFIGPPQQQVMNTMGSDSDDDARFLAKHFYQMKR